MATNSRLPRSLIMAAVLLLGCFAIFAITYSFRTSGTIEQSAQQHGSQAASGSATNNPQPTRTDTVR